VAGEALPELAPSTGARASRRGACDRHRGCWTATTVAHVVPFVAAGIALVAVQPLACP
jgi:hypothetical protein